MTASAPADPARLARCVADLPRATSPRDAGRRLAGELHREGTVLVVLDDDPGDCRGVAGAPLLLSGFGDDELARAIASGHDVVVLRTGSHALPEAAAAATCRALAERATTVARRLGAEARFVSCGEPAPSPRAHAEPWAAAEGAQAAGAAPVEAVLLCVADPGEGRVTVAGVQCRLREGLPVPVGRDLRSWAAARMGVPREEVDFVNLADIRLGGAARVAELLYEVRDGQIVVLDAASREDLEVLALGIAEAERAGRRFVCRGGHALAAARAGRRRLEPLAAPSDGPARPDSRPSGLAAG